MRNLNRILAGFALSITLAACSDTAQTEKLFSYFLERHVQKVKPLYKSYKEAAWSTYTGKSSFKELATKGHIVDSLFNNSTKTPEYYQSLLKNVYAVESEFDILKKIKLSGLIQDPILQRQFNIVYNEYISQRYNWEESKNKRTALLEQFYTLKKNETAFWDSINKTNTIDGRNQWIERFANIEVDFKAMVKANNADFRQLGYSNYYQSILERNSVDPKMLKNILEQVDSLTRNDYVLLKSVCDSLLIHKLKIDKNEITPEHYSKVMYGLIVPRELKQDYTNDEFLKLISTYFSSGGYDIQSIIDRSDLWFSKEKINQEFYFCMDSEENDLRIFANCKPDLRSLNVLFHEFGHAVHQKYVDKEIPYLLKEPSTITTEATAIYFDHKLYSSTILPTIIELKEESKETKELKIFSAFCNPARLLLIRVLLRNIEFEQGIYENPDQNFTKLWWYLNQKYLLYTTDNANVLPYWITNSHIINADGIHTFYLFATAMAAQLEFYYPDNQFNELKSNYFRFGDLKPWNELLENATGEKLNISYLINSYRKEKKHNYETSI